MTKDRLEQAALHLIEHFDSVQIIATSRTDDGGTALHAWGRGNWYARFGGCQQWMSSQDEDARIQERMRNEN